VIAGVPHHRLVGLGVLPRRIRTLWEIARRARRLEACIALPPDEASSKLQSIRGIGPWTAEHVVAAALGHADAVPTGDLYMPRQVCAFLAGVTDGDDTRMLELLEPYRGHRWRVIQWIRRSSGSPRRGPLPARVSRG
jgi:3-methyladenine DNA glycosylase/8-oxoguanine DNA glycosylase